MAKPNVVVVKMPGLAGGRGPAGEAGVSAVNNIVNPILSDNYSFVTKTEITPLGYEMAPSITLTFEATLVLKGLIGSTAIVYVEGPAESMVSGIMTYPYSAAPQPSGNSVAFGITTGDDDYYVVKIAGSVRNGNSTGRVNLFVENIDEQDGGYVAASSFVQWSIPVFAVIGNNNGGGGTANGGVTVDQGNGIWASRNDTRLTDNRVPVDRSVNANKIAAGGLPISSIDQLRNELDIRIKTINGTSPDSTGNINVSSGGGVSGISEDQASNLFVKLTDTRLSDQRIPLDNSVVNIKVPNAALEVAKISGLSAVLDAYTAQIANLTYRLQQVEQNGATPGGGTVGSGYPAVYTATY